MFQRLLQLHSVRTGARSCFLPIRSRIAASTVSIPCPWSSQHTREHSTESTDSPAAIVDRWRQEMLQREVVTHDTLVASPFNLLANTLEESAVPFQHEQFPPNGTVIPATWHHVYFPPRMPNRDLACDGYETDFFPPSPFVQRMWGGAKYTWSPNSLRVGQNVTMKTTMERTEHQQGRLGDSCFVWLNKDIENENGWSMQEQRCLVYLTRQDDRVTPSRAIPAKKTPAFSKIIHPASILLFRYSALTFNAHLIHYDHLYATGKEHHPACLVHGPLSGTMMMGLLRNHLADQGSLDEARFRSFQYRCLMPLYVGQPLKLCGRRLPATTAGIEEYELWIANHQGNLAVKGTVELATA
ncbi:uncharacterized protein BYT42DRAFT_562703 [Radiomyces spectabilis]|uniref:uncharacterized protein n=1 Tax=Radiomyces spectabilis TaxID=64574 RepID=UPI00222040AA|nr:uncharacterized protein BYT42DRAFT_562703 [Radiomyces spectabilis]KAI8384495.1 hypothetical protein BYT42DRAFT_562703 [Radiomyces spectabilis]